MKTPGMTLIEMVIALAIASLLSLLLFQSFNQSQKTTWSLDALLDYSATVPTMYNQLDKDISTIFVPEQVFRELIEEQKKGKNKEQEKQKNTEEKETKKIEKFKNIFVVAKKDKNVDFFSFLSTHSLSLFNEPVPNSVRVLYRLTPARNGLFSLMRQESIKLDFPLEKFKSEKIREYALMHGIKEFSIQLMIPEKSKEENQKESEKKSEDKKYKIVEAWLPNETELEEKKSEALIPEYIIIKGVFVHEGTRREYGFEWWFHTAAFDGIAQRIERIKNPPKTPETKLQSKESQNNTQNQQEKQNQGKK